MQKNVRRKPVRVNPPLSIYPMLDPRTILQYHLIWALSFLKPTSLLILLQQPSVLSTLYFTILIVSSSFLNTLSPWSSFLTCFHAASQSFIFTSAFFSLWVSLYAAERVCDQSLEVEAGHRCSKSHIQISFHTAEGEKTWHSTPWGEGGRQWEEERQTVFKSWRKKRDKRQENNGEKVEELYMGEENNGSWHWATYSEANIKERD